MQQASDKSVIISEILDPRTKNLLSMSKISDYVLSNELVSMALAMVAEDRQINDVLEELFAEEVIIFWLIILDQIQFLPDWLISAPFTSIANCKFQPFISMSIWSINIGVVKGFVSVPDQ